MSRCLTNAGPANAEGTAKCVWDESKHATRDSLVIVLLGAVIFTFALGPEFIGFQSRFGAFAQEMWRRGPTFLPTMYGRAYPDYPATSVFLIYLTSMPFGRVTPFSAVLPTAVASALVLMLTYRIGATRSRWWGWGAMLLALSTVEFLGDSRTIALDQYTSLATAASFYCVYSAGLYGRPRRISLLPLAWVVGFAFRGPIGLVVPVAVVCGYYFWSARLRQLALAGLAGAIMLVLCMVGLLAAAKAQGGQPLLRSVLDAQVTGRIEGDGDGFAYYWLSCFGSYALSYPMAVLVVACRFKSILRRTTGDDLLLGGLASWALVVLAGMSIPAVKHDRYLLPMVPAISLIASYLVIGTSPKSVLLAVGRWFQRLGPICAWLAAAAVMGAFVLNRWFGLRWEAHYLATLIALVLLTVAAGRFRRRAADRTERAVWSLSSWAIVFVVVGIGVADPIYYSLERTRPLVKEVEDLQKARPGDIVFFDIGPDREDVKFVANMSTPAQPRFASSFEQLLALNGPHYIIAREQVFESLTPAQRQATNPLTRGKIGHENVVVFSLNVVSRR